MIKLYYEFDTTIVCFCFCVVHFFMIKESPIKIKILPTTWVLVILSFKRRTPTANSKSNSQPAITMRIIPKGFSEDIEYNQNAFPMKKNVPASKM